MFKFFLIVIFLNSSGEVIKKDGWEPRNQPDWKICIERRNFARENHITKDGIKTHWFCHKIMI